MQHKNVDFGYKYAILRIHLLRLCLTKYILFMKKKQSFQAYAIISASVSQKVSEKVRSVISQHGKFIKNGVVVTPHGIDNVTFCDMSA